MIRMLQDDDQAQWRALWAQYLDFDGSTLDAIVHDRTWARLLDQSEPMYGALALAGDEAVGLVHYIFHRSTWSLSDSCYLQDLFVAPTVRGKGYGGGTDHPCLCRGGNCWIVARLLADASGQRHGDLAL